MIKKYLAIALVFAAQCLSEDLYAIKSEDMTEEHNDGQLELIMTPEEITETHKWKERTMSDLIDDAMRGDRGALYMLGMSCLIGSHGIPIDGEMADALFARSASLGFAPSIDKIRRTHVFEKEGNAYLMMVYLNLTASSGHPELIVQYHKFRSFLSQKAGREFVKKIEKIAAHKKATILKNQEAYANAPDKQKFFADMHANGQDITQEDKHFGMEYWVNAFQESENK